MIKITLPNIDRQKAKEIVESIYGVMYWQHDEGRLLSYPLGADNPVIIESSPNKPVEPTAEVKPFCEYCKQNHTEYERCIPE